MRRAALVGPGILLLLTICLFWKLTLTRQFTWADHPDAANQVLPWLQFQAREWHNGRVPLWDAFNWGGQPLLGRMEPGAAFPLNWILFALPLKDGFLSIVVLNWYFALLHYFAAIGCYWLCRDLKRSRAASILAGVAFGLGGYVGTIGWPQKLNSALWTPLVLLFFFRAVRGERPVTSACLSGGFLGLAWLGGHHQIPTLVSVAMAALWLWHLIEQRSRWRQALGQSLVFWLFTLAAGGLQILPAVEFGRLAIRWVGASSAVGWGDSIPYTVHAAYGLHPASTLGIIFPHVDRGANQFIGVVALSIAAVGVWTCWQKKREVRVIVSVALAGLLFALASYVVFHGVMYALVPLVEKARSPGAAIHLFHLGVAVTAAYGLDACRSPAVRGAALAVLIRILAVFSVAVQMAALVLMAVRPAQGIEYDGMLITATMALLLAALLETWRKKTIRPRTAFICVLLLMSIELGNVTGWDYKHKDQSWEFLPKLKEFHDVADFIRTLKGPVRAEIDVNDVPFNFGEWYGIEHFNGNNGLTANVARLFAHQTRLRELFGVNLYIGRKPYRDGQVELYSRPDGLKIFGDPNVMTRAWTVHEVVQVPKGAEVQRVLEETDFRQRGFMFTTPPEVERCEAGDVVELVSRGSANVIVDAEMKCRGMVVLADTYYPGWKASVDGRAAEIHEVNGAIRGVVVEAGRHRLEFVYRPLSAIIGGGLTALGFLGMVIIGWSRRPHRASGFSTGKRLLTGGLGRKGAASGALTCGHTHP
jgi:hypothetical protein